MPAKSTVQYECDRCGRLWYGEGAVESTARAVLTMESPDGALMVDVSFEVLCASCSHTVHSLLAQAAKDVKTSRRQRRGKREAPEGAAP